MNDRDFASTAPDRVRRTRLGSLVWLVLAASCLISTPLHAEEEESVGNKANARTLATEGIDSFTEGRYAEALDRLQRAQALFDAPIHLLYIARSQAKLGKLVEASETYRRLIRVELNAETPAAVREAVEAADAELDGVDARLAALRIEVVPAGQPGLVLFIDGEPVSAAVVGVDRPVNPGHHRIQARVPDGRSAEESIELGEGAKVSVRVELGPAPARPRPAPPAPEQPTAKDSTAWFFGAGLGAALPLGNIAKDPEVRMGDYMKPGAALDLYAGIRFARFLGAKVFVEVGGFVGAEAPGADISALSSGAGAGDVVEIEAAGGTQSLGLSFIAGTPAHRLGGYGELGLVVGQRVLLTRNLTLPGDRCGGKAEQTLSLTGGALRVGGGAFIPVSKVFQLTPFVHGSFGQFTDAELESDCPELPGPGGLSGELEGTRRSTHGLLLIGLGGEFVFGFR